MVRMSSWNTVPMRPLTTPRPFNAWLVAVLAYVIGSLVTFVLGFVIGTAGVLVMTGMALSGDPSDASLDEIVNVTVIVALVIGVISLAVQAWFIHRRGGARPVLGSVVARGASLLVGFAVTPLALGDSLVTGLGIGVEIVLLALLIKPLETPSGRSR